MKTFILSLLLFLTNYHYSFSTVSINEKSDRLHHAHASFKVYSGDCKECRKSIEKIVSKLSGVESVELDLKRKMLTVVYDPIVITPKIIKEEVSGAGYDTDTTKATKEAYEQLIDCCKYKRKP